MAGLLDFLFPSAGGVNPFSSGPLGLQTFPDAMRASAFRLGIKPEDLATAISYETGGTFDPAKKGPTTKWGQHKGLIQFGEPQAKKYGVDFSRPAEDQMPAVTQYLLDAGVKPGMGLPDIYSAINAGAPGRYNASDRPGYTVAKHVASMAPHQEKAAMFLGGIEPTIQQDPSTVAQPPAPPTKEPVMADATSDPISQLLAQYAQQAVQPQSQGLLGQIFPGLKNSAAGGLFNNPDLSDKLMSIGAGLASGRGWGPGFGAGLQMYQHQRDRRQDQSQQGLMNILALSKLNEPTSLMQNLKAAGVDFNTPEGQAIMKEAILKPQTQVSLGQEGAFNTSSGKLAGDELRASYDAAKASGAKIQTLNTMQHLVNAPDLYQGPAGEQVQQLKTWAKDVFGIDVKGQDVGAVFDALSKQLALQARSTGEGSGMPGALSDADRNFLVQQVPGFGRGQEGNKLLIEITRRLEQRKMDENRERFNYIQKNKSLDGLNEHMAEWGKAQADMFADFAQLKPASAVPTAPATRTQGGPTEAGAATAPTTPGRYVYDPITNTFTRQ